MDVVLMMCRESGSPRPFPVTKDSIVVGRREDCDLRIALGDVSRKHCRLTFDAAGTRIEDLGSSNGTYVNGNRIQNIELEPGDTIQVGPVVFVLQVDGQPPAADLQPITRNLRQSAPASEDSMTQLDDSEMLNILELDDSKS